MKISRRTTMQCTILEIEGEIDLYNAAELKQALIDELAMGNIKLLLALVQVAYIDSTGIGAMLAILSEARRRGGDLKLMQLSPGAQKVFELTRLSNFFNIFDDEAAAISAFSAG